MAQTQQPRTCPICGEDTGHVNNHVRMRNDDDHGPTQQYPDGWDKSLETFDQSDREPDDTGDAGKVLDGVLEDDGDDEPGAVPIEIEDRPSDMREYECPECEATIEYLDAECPNEHEQQWYA